MLTNVLAFILLIGILVFIHEFGHFIVARICGVGVEVFSLGFGPRLIGKKIGRTDYRISLIPLGGYVKMVGENPGGKVNEKDIPESYFHKHVVKRILIVSAGCFFNVLLAVIIFTFIFFIKGQLILEPEVGKTIENSPASIAGIMEKDKILAVNNRPIKDWQTLNVIIILSEGKPLVLSIERNGKIVKIKVIPKKTKIDNPLSNKKTERYTIGIIQSENYTINKLNLFRATVAGIKTSWDLAHTNAVFIKQMIAGTQSAKDNLGGPIAIAQLSGDIVKEGALSFMAFTAQLSIMLALINLLPVPILDGGHLLFLSIEAIRRRPVSLKIQGIAQQIGLGILLIFMIFVFSNDIARLFFK